VAAALHDGGCDIDSGGVYYHSLLPALSKGSINLADIKLALHRTIKLRFELGGSFARKECPSFAILFRVLRTSGATTARPTLHGSATATFENLGIFSEPVHCNILLWIPSELQLLE
jgi:hypothetical protein